MTLIPALATLNESQNHLFVRWHEPGIAEVVLANPEQRNAMSEPMTRAWEQVMGALPEIAELRAVLIRGQGSAFCAGGDLGWIAGDGTATVPQLSERMDLFYAAWLRVAQVPVPTVAYMNGPAVGAGAAVALACDIRWAGPGAKFSVPFTRLGLHPGMGTTYLLTQAVGAAMAKDLLLTSRTIDAAQMLACGAATEEVAEPEVLDRVRRIAGNAPIAARLTKRGLSPRPPQTLAEALRYEGLAQPVTMASEDVQEGLAAARQRRQPVFRNR